MKTKRYDTKKHAKYRIPMGIIMLAVGIILQLTDTLSETTLGSISFSYWLILTGSIVIIFSLKNYFYPREYVIDERGQKIINQASRLTFTSLIYLCLIIFIIGMINPMQVSISTFASLVLFYTIFFYKIAYWHYVKKT